MANNIERAKAFVPILDEVYKNASLTSVLDGNQDLVREGANVDEMIIPTLDMQGMGDYSRNSGYTQGDVTLKSETVKCNYDRGRRFSVDVMDNTETEDIAFGRLSGEFIRTKAVPELDAFRFAAYASKDGVTSVEETLEDGARVIKAIRAGVTKLDEDEVPADERYLFITPTLRGMISDLDTTKSREVLDGFASIVSVPQTRFYTKIKLQSGKDGEEAGGYKKDEAGEEINFMIIARSAIIQYPKHVAPKIIAPENNPDADAYIFGYRLLSIADVYANKLAGVYVNHKSGE